VRQTDLVTKTGSAEFTLVTGSINFDAARSFARRVCRAVAHADLVKDTSMSFIASCGLASLTDDRLDSSQATLAQIQELAYRRAQLGLGHALSGIVGREEEAALQRGDLAVAPPDNGQHVDPASPPDLATLVQWIKEGRRSEVLPHLENLSAELKPIVHLLLKRNNA
jgi:two-component system, cell cycle response regulator